MSGQNNVITAVSKDGKSLTITIDLTKDLGDSKSGKTRTIATSHTGQPIAIGPNGNPVILSMDLNERKPKAHLKD